ncbi:type IV secretion system DNA-binding domain-containing protein [Patescibacteria group bacterium]|nr:type IV secretion system DNA-binding domain-containing protein [Patescibacteria group bacterium]MBU1967257.1 type IV secretion system DNA-binding domain-containing protein [Patescibacteria group bacterium]MBU2543029.1 type IV secretion system DNA-binding domain-containing protein [Patescibacteria group bacterium]
MTDLNLLLQQLMQWTINGVLILLLIALLVVFGYMFFQWFKHRRREDYSLDFVTLLVRLPRDNEIKIDAAEQMFTGLYSLKKSGPLKFLQPEDIFSFEIVALQEKIGLHVNCPRNIRDLVEKQIHGAYPQADIKEIDEVNIFNEKGKVAFATLKLEEADYLPIRTYKDLPTDGLSLITSAMSKMGHGDGAILQIILEPASKKWQKKGKSYISRQKKREADPDTATYGHDPKEMEAISTKAEKPGFRVAIRIVVSAENEALAESHLNNIKGAFSQFTSAHNSFKKVRFLLKHLLMIDFLYRYMPLLNNTAMILNSEELATIFHFPNKTVETHHIEWLNAKNAPAPNEIPTEGLYMGQSFYRGEERPVFMNLKDRRRHMYIVGKTGTGKSEYLKELILQDIEAGHGVCAIDPHGDFVEDVLELMPSERAEDVIYFNPSDLERPMGMNIMEAKTEDQMHFVSSSVINLMYKLYDPHRTGIIGPRFEHAIRNAMLTIMCRPGATFIELVRALTDSKFVDELLPYVKDPIVKRYWTDQIAQTSDFHKSEVLDYITSKFGRFVTNKTMRNIIGQPKSAFDFREAMDTKKIILCNLSKGILGEEDAKFLGLILVPKVLTAAMSRQNVPMENRPDFFLYVDEFQNFATEDFAVILSEARKYRLNLIVANQYISQIDEEVKNAVFGNVGTMVSFRIGVTDANFLQHEFVPVFNETDLTNVEKYHIYMKTIVDNEPVPPFSLSLLKDLDTQNARKNPKLAEMIKQLSRLKYGIDREQIEAEIKVRARL